MQGGEFGDREEHQSRGPTSVQEGGATLPLSLTGSAPVASSSTAARSLAAMPTPNFHGVLSSFCSTLSSDPLSAIGFQLGILVPTLKNTQCWCHWFLW
jgi:hypothetical protein